MALSKNVQKAVEIIYKDLDFANGKTAFNMLKEAADAGDGDACMFLARCYGGDSFCNSKFKFPVNAELYEEYLNKSVELGSELGMLLAFRMNLTTKCGTYYYAPYNSLREVWDAVAQRALAGETFCQLLIANEYFWGDAIEIFEMQDKLTSKLDLEEFRKNMALTARDMYEEIFMQGYMINYYNYIDIINGGKYGLNHDSARYNWIKKLCKDRGISI